MRKKTAWTHCLRYLTVFHIYVSAHINPNHDQTKILETRAFSRLVALPYENDHTFAVPSGTLYRCLLATSDEPANKDLTGSNLIKADELVWLVRLFTNRLLQ